MINYNELKPGTYITHEGDPYEIMEYAFLRMQQRKPVAQVKMRNLITGNTMPFTFHQSDKIEDADISYKNIKFLYSHRDECWFCEVDNPKERFTLPASKLGSKVSFLKPNTEVEAMLFEDKIIDVRLPIKMEVEVVEAPPSIKGNTAQGGTKQIKIETGATINVPLFINQGDIIRVNTLTGEYSERVEKK